MKNVIAIIWDFDKTLIPGYMQEPLFQDYGVEGDQFWEEVKKLPEEYNKNGTEFVSADTVYLNHILAYVREGKFSYLSNAKLRELGRKLDFYPGMPEFLETLKEHIHAEQKFKHNGITVEHYVVSTGLRQMILGSKVAASLREVWGCEFAEGSPKPGYLTDRQGSLWADRAQRHITDVAYAIDNATKTRAIFEINKGTNHDPKIDVNATIAH